MEGVFWFKMSNSPLHKILLINEDKGEINMELLRDYASQGVPDNDIRLRYYLWQVLLHVLPTDRTKWDSHINQRNAQYWVWVKSCFGDEDWLQKDFSSETTVKKFGLRNDGVMMQIYGDVIRMPDSMFIDSKVADTIDEVKIQTKRIQRMLYVFSCLNSAYGYTQGFNEIIMPLFQVVASVHKLTKTSMEMTESITFFLFQNLITGTGLGDLFTMEQDFESVSSRFSIINQMVKLYDKELFDSVFSKQEVDPLQYAFSWVTLLFTQIYSGNQLFYLWDKFLLKKINILEYAMAIAAAHLIELKPRLMGHNFGGVLEVLHNMEPQDVTRITVIAELVWSQYLQNK
jgi:hypothetical protein